MSWLIEKPNTDMPMNAPMSATGTTSVGMSVARKLCRNTSITMNTSDHGDEQRDHHFVDGGIDEDGGIERQEPLHARGEAGRELVHARLDLLRHFERIRARRQQDAEARDGLVVEPHIEANTC